MSKNQRNSARIGLVIDIKLTCVDNSEYTMKSRNISDLGVFLEFDETPLTLPMGTQVILQGYPSSLFSTWR